MTNYWNIPRCNEHTSLTFTRNMQLLSFLFMKMDIKSLLLDILKTYKYSFKFEDGLAQFRNAFLTTTFLKRGYEFTSCNFRDLQLFKFFSILFRKQMRRLGLVFQHGAVFDRSYRNGSPFSWTGLMKAYLFGKVTARLLKVLEWGEVRSSISGWHQTSILKTDFHFMALDSFCELFFIMVCTNDTQRECLLYIYNENPEQCTGYL